jgi:alkylation response protein AidB-like acyl-CoA dehydrogenase
MTTVAAANLGTESERWLAAARALAPLVAVEADAAEAERRLTDPVVAAFKAAGFYRMWLPHDLGGAELDPLTAMRVVEELARADGSAGWCVGPAHAANLWFQVPRLAREVTAAVFADPDTILVESIQPRGRAVAVPGGYRVSGRWPFGSGASHGTWFSGRCAVYDGDEPRRLPDGTPELHLFLLPPAAVTVHDTWTTTGLRATASHDWSVEDAFVPEERVSGFRVDPVEYPWPLFRSLAFNCALFAACVLGIARHALDAFTELAAAKLSGTPPVLLRDQLRVQNELARAEAGVRGARCYLYQAVGAYWQAALLDDAPPLTARAEAALASELALTSALAAAETAYRLAGSSAVYAGPLDRCLRDLHTAAAHMVFGPAQWEAAGRVCLGLEPGAMW